MNVLLVGSDTRANGLAGGRRRSSASATEVGGPAQRHDHDPARRPAGEEGGDPVDPARPLGDHRRHQQHGPHQHRVRRRRPRRRSIETITQTLGIPINHYVEVDFVGFRGIVERGRRRDDPVPGAGPRHASPASTSRPPGCVKLDGDQALAYARSRHYQYVRVGPLAHRPHRRPRPHPAPAGLHPPHDAQGDLQGPRNPLKLNRLVDHRHQERHDRQRRCRPRTSSSWQAVPVARPRRGRHAHAARHQRHASAAPPCCSCKQPEAQEIIDRFNGTTPGTVAGAGAAAEHPAQHRAGARAQRLRRRRPGRPDRARSSQRLGFNVAGSGDADAFTYVTPVIRYGRASRQGAAARSATSRRRPAAARTSRSQGVDVVLVDRLRRHAATSGAARHRRRPPRDDHRPSRGVRPRPQHRRRAGRCRAARALASEHDAGRLERR